MTDDIPESKITKKALHRIRLLARGNGAQKDSIRIIQDNSEIINCEAITHIEIEHTVQEAKKVGKHAIGEPIGDITALPSVIQKLSEGALKNGETRKGLASILLKRPDKGFAIHGKYFDLEVLSREFHSFKPCDTCKGQGLSPCQTCGGRRLEPCNQCHGRTTINCNYCRGSGFIKGPDGNQKQCNRCFGKRQIRCPLCQSRGSISCRKCKGSGSSKCSPCEGKGVFTFITKIMFKMKTIFEIDSTVLPAPALKLVENNGGKLVEQKDIKAHGEAVKREDGGLAIQYKVRFPYADLAIGVNGQPIKVHMFGYKARMVKITSFLDQLVEKSYALLTRAGRGEGNIVSHINKASKTRMIGEALLLSVSMRPKKAMGALKKKYPMGASNDLIKGLILQSNKALANISRKSHLSGIGIGLAITALIDALYFLGPMRSSVQNFIGANTPLLFVDFLLIPLGGFITMMISKYMAVSPLKKALGSLMSAKQRAAFKPRNQNSQWPAYVASVIIFIAFVFVAKFMGASAPSWLPF